jgi:PAS domain S-box-containing protein
VLGHKTLGLLQEWRDAERRWEALGRGDPAAAEAARDVAVRWLAYQEATTRDPEEFILVADNLGRYVAASTNAIHFLGYSIDELTTRSVADLTPRQHLEDEQRLWDAFLRDGRQEGTYRLHRRDGSLLDVTYEARAHYPIPGHYVSRLRPAGDRAAPT